MSRQCPISGCETNCTDTNCASCMAEEKRYVIRAYLEKSMSGCVKSLETDSWDEVEAFIWESVQKGLNCKFIDRQSRTGDGGEAYADLFNENIIYVDELIVWHSFM